MTDANHSSTCPRRADAANTASTAPPSLPHLPGIVIFVHGVNSEGEWYDAAEAALCQGLNERLRRDDLTPNRYAGADPVTGQYRPRRLERAGRSPVIRFYWGYRAPSGNEGAHRVPLRNAHGANFWLPEGHLGSGPWFWGGGPFQNGTNNLQQLWSDAGFRRRLLGIDLQRFNPEWERELHDAPPRTYFAHAAQRLAGLIDKIRDTAPRDTVSIVSHSQGTLLALAAVALCRRRAPDAVFLMNSPYALDDKLTDYLTCGNARPTEGARVRTFQAIAARIRQDRREFTAMQLAQLRVSGDGKAGWPCRPGQPERDNHGRLHVYFNPHDRVIGARPIQGIGWQGLPDALLAESGDTVRQRMLARGTPCGDAPGVKPFGTLPPIPDPEHGVAPGDFWNGNQRVLGTDLWLAPPASRQVTINAEPVPHPLTADEMAASVTSTVITAQGTQRKAVYFDAAPSTQSMWGARHPERRHAYLYSEYPYLAALYRPQRMMVRDDVHRETGQRVELETAQELRHRIATHVTTPTNHSTLPAHAEFMRRVVACDLPIGFCDSHTTEFWHELIHEADWTSGRDPYYAHGELHVPPMPPQIDRETVSEAINRADAEKLLWRGV